MQRLLFALVFSLALLLAACGGPGNVTGSGTITTQTRQVSGFTGITVTTSADMFITMGDADALTIEADDNLLPYLTADVRGGVLTLGTTFGATLIPTRPYVYRLTVRALNTLTLDGSGTVTGSDLALTGFSVTVNGSYQITLGGTADSQTVTFNGMGTYDARTLNSTAAVVRINGSGMVLVRASDSLDASVAGSGSIIYYGDPTLTQEISGSGRIAKGD